MHIKSEDPDVEVTHLIGDDLILYLSTELKYHQERYIQGESRAAKLATLAALLSTASIALSSNTELVSNLPTTAKIGFVISIMFLFLAAVTSLLGLLPTDKFGKLTKPWLVVQWIRQIDTAAAEVRNSGNHKETTLAVNNHSDVIFWQERTLDEKSDSLVVRSRIISLLAFKRSIGLRQLSTTLAIALIYLSMVSIIITALVVAFLG